MSRYILEACVDSVESAILAVKGGANRLELCSNLIIGGTTPGVSQFQQIRNICSIPIHVLVRPRFGDFLYTDYEFQMIAEDVSMFSRLGADGIVAGCLKPEGELDVERMKILREKAGHCHLTLHRGFDMCRDPYRTLEEAAAVGINTILTSGQENTCLKGKELLKELVRQADQRVDILAGGGVNGEVISCLFKETGVRSFHMSGKIELASKMEYRNKKVNMGIPGISEYTIFRTEEGQIRRAAHILEALCAEET